MIKVTQQRLNDNYHICESCGGVADRYTEVEVSRKLKIKDLVRSYYFHLCEDCSNDMEEQFHRLAHTVLK